MAADAADWCAQALAARVTWPRSTTTTKSQLIERHRRIIDLTDVFDKN
jgi:hypothetical protein